MKSDVDSPFVFKLQRSQRECLGPTFSKKLNLRAPFFQPVCKGVRLPLSNTNTILGSVSDSATSI